jgi:hypothetical protein
MPMYPPPPNQHYQPPIQQLTISVQQPFAGAASDRFNHGIGGGGRGGAVDRDVMDVGAVAINAHCSQTLDAPKVAETLAKAAVVEGFHRPQERFIYRHQLLCPLMHGT